MSPLALKQDLTGGLKKSLFPVTAVLSIYAKENGEGMFFDTKEELLRIKRNQKPNLNYLRLGFQLSE